MGNEKPETILKKEELKLKKNAFSTTKGELILTNARVYFIKKGKNEDNGKLFEAHLNSIVNVRAYKAFSAGEDDLEIKYSVEGNKKEQKTTFMRNSVAQWASSASSLGKGGAMGRLEANSLSNWEMAIMQARADLNNPVASQNNSSGNDIAGEIAKLAELHKQGVLNDQEFTDAKARLINK